MTYNRTGGAAGGSRARIARTFHRHPLMFNQNNGNSLDQRKLDFLELAQALVKATAREALDRNPTLTPKQKEKLRDAERGRFDVKLLALLLEGMAESASPLFFADQIRAATLRSVVGSATPCVVDSYITNTRAQKEGDIAQALFLVERTPARRDQLADALGPEELTLHFHKLSVLAWNPTNRRVFA